MGKGGYLFFFCSFSILKEKMEKKFKRIYLRGRGGERDVFCVFVCIWEVDLCVCVCLRGRLCKKIV